MLPAGHIYATPGESVVNLAHESTHGVNSRIRNYLAQQPGGAGVNAFFVGQDRGAFVLREPRIPLALVARYVPAECRGVSFNLYLVQQAGQWNEQPLYVLDEWTAYVNGAVVGLESGRPEAYELQQAIEFCGYATALLLCVERHDKTYSDKERINLEEFIGWQCGRVRALSQTARKIPAAWSLGCERALGNFEKRFCKEVRE